MLTCQLSQGCVFDQRDYLSTSLPFFSYYYLMLLLLCTGNFRHGNIDDFHRYACFCRGFLFIQHKDGQMFIDNLIRSILTMPSIVHLSTSSNSELTASLKRLNSSCETSFQTFFFGFIIMCCSCAFTQEPQRQVYCLF